MPYVNHRVVRDALDTLDMSTEQLAAAVRRNVKTVRNVVGAHQVTSMRHIVQICKAIDRPIEDVVTLKNRVEQDADSDQATEAA